MSTGTARPVCGLILAVPQSAATSKFRYAHPLVSRIHRHMARRPRALLLFCLASGTDWTKVPITQATTQHLLVRGLIDRDQGAGRYALTPLGRDVLAALIQPPGQ
jgi:hypothetical protein